MLDISYPYSILNAAMCAVQHLSDPRAQAWIVRRMPGAGVRVEPITLLPYPWVDLAADPDMATLYIEPHFRKIRDTSPILVDAEKRARASYDAVLAGHRGGESVIGAMESHFPVGCAAVFDWLSSLEDSDPRMLDKLPRVTWDQAVEHAKRWHDRLAAMREDGVAGDKGTANLLPVARIEGWYWTQLVTKGALDREGVVMGHCVGSRAYDRYAWTGEHQGPATGIWSLRNADGRSKVTVEVASDGFGQVYGPENERPAPETAPAFETLVGFFAPPGKPFRLPRWLERGEDGQTSLRITRPIGQIVTEMTATVEITFSQFTPLMEALGAMLGDAVTEMVDGIRGDPEPTSFEEILPEVKFTPNERRARGREPWYRQHERARAGRPR